MIIRNGWARCAENLLVGTLIVLAAVAPAQARVFGSCEAWYQIRSGTAGDVEAYTGRFEATGVAASSMVEARGDARERLERCITDHWLNRNLATAPDSCTRVSAEGVGVSGYPFGDILHDIRALACAANPGREVLFVSVVAVVEGDDGCRPPGVGWAIDPFPPWLRIECAMPAEITPLPQLERLPPEPERIVPVPQLEPALQPPLPGIRLPGHDIRRDWIGDERWPSCQRRCEETRACRAWTWRAPGTSGPGSEAACLLKSAAGWQIPDSCCHSGLRD